MAPPSPPWDELLAPALTEPDATAVLFDLDGTLAPIVERPVDVAIPDALVALLPWVAARFGLVAFISGRGLDELRRVVGMTGVAYSGNHGHEVVDVDGAAVRSVVDESSPVRDFLTLLDASDLGRQGIWIEDKNATATLHYRTAHNPHAAREYLEEHVTGLARERGLRVAPGRMSLEVHPDRDVSKGTATRMLLGRHPAIRHAISFGDDRTDVAVWVALDGLTTSGRLATALGIGVASDETPAEVTAYAHVMVHGVAGVEQVVGLLVNR